MTVIPTSVASVIAAVVVTLIFESLCFLRRRGTSFTCAATRSILVEVVALFVCFCVAA